MKHTACLSTLGRTSETNCFTGHNETLYRCALEVKR